MPEPSPEIHVVHTRPEPAEAGDRNTIGGWPILAAGEAWPLCYCGERMVFFFQVDVPPGVPAFGGHHLLVFQCPTHDDVAVGPAQLPERFWDEAAEPYEGPFWRILFRTAGAPAADADPYLQGHRLAVRPDTESVDEYGRGSQGFKLGGVPSWAQYPEHYRCACGTDLAFVCQVPENFGFDMWPMKAQQSGGTSDDQVHLFLGSEIYILACPARCHPEAAWPVLQN